MIITLFSFEIPLHLKCPFVIYVIMNLLFIYPYGVKIFLKNVLYSITSSNTFLKVNFEEKDVRRLKNYFYKIKIWE